MMNPRILLIVCIALCSGCALNTNQSSGVYVEARTASVFAGACHYGAEYTTSGREAVMAWRFDEGIARGAEVVAFVRSGVNLAESSSDRQSVVYLGGSLEACELALQCLRARGHLGEILRVEEGALIRARGEEYEVIGGSDLHLKGELLIDRSCCSMPSQRWYSPLGADAPGVVGNSEVFECDVPALGVRFARTGDNDAIVSSFIL